MRDPIVDDLVTRFWNGLVNGDRLEVRVTRFEKLLPDVIAEARALCAFAELVAKESTATAVRAAAAKLDDASRTSRGESMLASGLVLKTSAPHLERVAKKVEAHNLAAEAERLRRSADAAGQDLAKARQELAARGVGVTPAERQTLENEVEIRTGLAEAAKANLVETEDRLAKLRTA